MRRTLPSCCAAAVAFACGCGLLDYFEDVPPARCTHPGAREQVPCDPCAQGSQVRVCGDDGRWTAVTGCRDNPFDADGDGFANQRCFDESPAPSCCGLLDCDDGSAERFPGALADVDGDDFFDDRCCTVDLSPLCTDCNDDDPYTWYLHADDDRDGHDDEACGGDDCDDLNGLRWRGHADLDGDGHTDVRCCTSTTRMCDDCNDDDPERWEGHADLDGDGHDDEACGGDDCDDRDPRRWRGHADVDGDGHVDSRCCEPGSGAACDDCDDDAPLRFSGHADLDGDGHDAFRCGGDDCDDDCPGCSPGAAPSLDRALDHDCSGRADEEEVSGCPLPELSLVAAADTGDSRALFVTDDVAYVATSRGLALVDVSTPSEPVVVRRLTLGDARDVTVYGDLVLVATASGLVVVERRETDGAPPELVVLGGPVETHDSRAVSFSSGFAFVASYEGLYVVDLSAPDEPSIEGALLAPDLHDVRDVQASAIEPTTRAVELVALSRSTARHPDGAVAFLRVSGSGSPVVWDEVALARGRRLGVCLGDVVGVASDEGVVAFLGRRQLGEAIPWPGARAVLMQCDGSTYRADAYVAGGAGLAWTDWSRLRATVEAGETRDVFFWHDRLYLATEGGFQVVETACP